MLSLVRGRCSKTLGNEDPAKTPPRSRPLPMELRGADAGAAERRFWKSALQPPHRDQPRRRCRSQVHGKTKVHRAFRENQDGRRAPGRCQEPVLAAQCVPALLVRCLQQEQMCCGRGECTDPAAWWGDCFVFYKFFLKQGLSPWPFFVVLWPLIFTRNHCVYMK